LHRLGGFKRKGLLRNVTGSCNAMLPRRWAFPTVLAIVLPVVGGCTALADADHGIKLLPAVSPYDPGIPVPVGFRLIDESSEDWSSGPTRYLRHRYRGSADKRAVRAFYREQMPLVRWTPINDGNVQGRITMRFQRGQESCTITIEAGRRGLSRHAVVEVLISPMTP
jgi:hypothetical protein